MTGLKIAICTIAYNEADFIRQCVTQWRPYHHVVLLSTKPWNGVPQPYDDTGSLAKAAGAEVITRYWENEATQRNWGLAYLYAYDYVLIVDPDEFYTKADREKIVNNLSGDHAYRLERMVTYWKTHDFVFNPPDSHKPIIAVDPKRVRFFEHRSIGKATDAVPEFFAPLIPVTCHHFSWVRSDRKVAEKIATYSHADIIPPLWYDEVWKVWNPESGLLVRPYGKEQSRAVYHPAPPELHDICGVV